MFHPNALPSDVVPSSTVDTSPMPADKLDAAYRAVLVKLLETAPGNKGTRQLLADDVFTTWIADTAPKLKAQIRDLLATAPVSVQSARRMYRRSVREASADPKRLSMVCARVRKALTDHGEHPIKYLEQQVKNIEGRRFGSARAAGVSVARIFNESTLAKCKDDAERDAKLRDWAKLTPKQIVERVDDPLFLLTLLDRRAMGRQHVTGKKQAANLHQHLRGRIATLARVPRGLGQHITMSLVTAYADEVISASIAHSVFVTGENGLEADRMLTMQMYLGIRDALKERAKLFVEAARAEVARIG